MRYVTAFFRFWYDFLVGDSWRLAAGAVGVMVAARALIVALPHLAPAVGPLFLLALLAVFCGVLLNEHR
jgi:hypothetical protein